MTKSEKELLKKEVRTYYEAHYEDIKQVAKLFKVNERTLYNWIQTEKWEKGKLVKNTELKAITNKLLNDKEVLDNIGIAKNAIKHNMRENMQNLYSIYEERILDNTADELLLKAMSETFIHTQITKTALIAQSEFNRLASLSVKSSVPNPKVIQAAKDVVSIFTDMKKCLYPNQDNTQVNIKAILNNGVISKEQIAGLTDEQIREYLGSETL
ncbi:hypothetical protein LS77_008700 [Helicobacter bilis]|uniref:Terminase n=2 Tax=Helicobacter bilis TaxID=37372 RepID=A0A6D2C7P0_9HELI|nr:hypothetical protein [Helicobacter bilis]EMZ37277.1 hypothetical protein C826_02139 [Helicobacter bilis WiWa]TLE03575.1 hypothetical protein LS77_008700 [Helicobacter bilis]TLE04299.1 hypothetical protein LS76_008690 [Helicobacter bilis]